MQELEHITIEQRPSNVLRRLAVGTMAIISMLQAPAFTETAQATKAAGTWDDADGDGIRNDKDKRMLTHDGNDADKDGIPNRIDIYPHNAAVADADYDGIKNSWDTYPFMPTAKTMNSISTYACSNMYDWDCDQIHNSQDRQPLTADMIDADGDGKENGFDEHPLVPHVATSIYEVTSLEYWCTRSKDNDCDGVVNLIDPDDWVAELPDVDGDGIKNAYDPIPYYNPYATRNGNNGRPYLDVSGKMYAPILLNTVTNTYITTKTIRDIFNYDTDGDGLNNAYDPYPNTPDWDNDGRLDGNDSQISVNQKRAEEKRLDERRQEQRYEQKRLEDQQQQARLERQRLEQQRIEDKAAERRLEQDRQRREDERRRQEGY